MPLNPPGRQKKWYVIAYDVRAPKRLRKLHYYLKKQAVALQKSIFLLHADKAQLEQVLAEIKSRVKDREDDVRLYPVSHPGAIWGAGKQSLRLDALYSSSSPKQHKSARAQGLLAELFGRRKR